jgi:hypothetical protein
MPRFLCSNCHEVVQLSNMRVDWCTACGECLSPEDRLPLNLVGAAPAQASTGVVGAGADLAAPALAATTSPIAASSRPVSPSPSTM